jgi:hypothetical protein
MSIVVNLGERLRGRTKVPSIEIAAATLWESIMILDQNYPGFFRDVYSESKREIRNGIRISLNGTAVQPTSETELKSIALQEGDEVYIFGSAAGG